jgi:hypothetical protein
VPWFSVCETLRGTDGDGANLNPCPHIACHDDWYSPTYQFIVNFARKWEGSAQIKQRGGSLYTWLAKSIYKLYKMVVG